ncbi:MULTISPECIES: organomercurial lyase [Streptomyces]|uniref:organomercurial lyase n=1 Tax=Streptomyces TaxID=1883 RepID=UPI000995FBD0
MGAATELTQLAASAYRAAGACPVPNQPGPAPSAGSQAGHLREPAGVVATGDYAAARAARRTGLDMCAIEARGISAMLGRDVVIASTDPVTDKAVTGIDGGEPPCARRGRDGVRRAALDGDSTACCDALNFFASAPSARAWAAEHPSIAGPGPLPGAGRADPDADLRVFAGSLTKAVRPPS